jgi:hypothetical protein
MKMRLRSPCLCLAAAVLLAATTGSGAVKMLKVCRLPSVPFAHPVPLTCGAKKGGGGMVRGCFSQRACFPVPSPRLATARQGIQWHHVSQWASDGDFLPAKSQATFWNDHSCSQGNLVPEFTMWIIVQAALQVRGCPMGCQLARRDVSDTKQTLKLGTQPWRTNIVHIDQGCFLRRCQPNCWIHALC